MEVSREGGHGTDTQDLALLRHAVFESVEKFLAAAEDRLGVVQGKAACLGEFQALFAPLEQCLAEAPLELAQLDAQRRGGDAQMLGGAGQVARLSDRPEITEMMVIEEGHSVFDLIKRSIKNHLLDQ